MADSKISALTAHAANPADTDLFVIVDVSDTTMAASGTNKKLAASYLATRTGTETWTNKTLTSPVLTTPTIADFTNATHTHADAAGGGTIAHSVLTGLTSGNPHTQYLLADGTTTGATSSTQTFTNGTKQAKIVVSSDGTAALTIRNAADSVSAITFDTTNYSIATGGGSTSTTYGVTINQVAHNNGMRVNGFDTMSAENFTLGINSAGTGAFATTSNMLFTCAGTILTFKSNNASGTLRFQNASNANIVYMTQSQTTGFGGVTSPTAWIDAIASTTSLAHLRLRIGSAPTSPNAGEIWNDGALTFFEQDSTTSSVVNTLVLRRSSSGTPGTGFGAGFRVGLKSSTTANQDAGRLTFAWNVATHASRAATGKLTAYYISTERESITWVADSTSSKVGINQTNPQRALHVTGDYIRIDTTTFTSGMDLGFDSSNAYLWNYQNTLLQFATNNTARMTIAADGKVGIGTASPQAILHGHDGSGGFIFVNRASVDGTLVTVIPDGTGDVTANISFFGWVSNSVPFTAQVTDQYLAVSSSTTFTDGTNTLTVAVTAGGAFTLQRTAGTATWNVCLWAFWR